MSESSFSQLKSHSSGKRKFLQDIPTTIDDENYSIKNQIYKELEDMEKEGELNQDHILHPHHHHGGGGFSFSSPSLPRWTGDISANVGLAHNSSSGSMGGIVTILASGDDDNIPNSHKSTRYPTKGSLTGSSVKSSGNNNNSSANSSNQNSSSSFSNYNNHSNHSSASNYKNFGGGGGGSNNGSASNYLNFSQQQQQQQQGGSNNGSASSYSIYNSNGGSNNGSASSFSVFGNNGGAGGGHSNNGSASSYSVFATQQQHLQQPNIRITTPAGSSNSSASNYNAFATTTANGSNQSSFSVFGSGNNVNSNPGSNNSSFNSIAPPSTPQIPSSQQPQQPQNNSNNNNRHFNPTSLFEILQKTVEEQSAQQLLVQQQVAQQQTHQQAQQYLLQQQQLLQQQEENHNSSGSLVSDGSRSSMSINNLINPDSVLMPPRSDFTLSPQSSQSLRSNNSSMPLTNDTTTYSNTSSVISSINSSNNSSINMAIDNMHISSGYHSGGQYSGQYSGNVSRVGSGNVARRPQTSTSNFMNSASLTGWVCVKSRQSILIIGPNGIGKSFLLNTILRSTFIPTISQSRPILGSHRGFSIDDSDKDTSMSIGESPINVDAPEQSNYNLLRGIRHMNQMNQSSNQTKIDHQYSLDDSFRQSVDWTKERELEMESIYKTSQYIHTKVFPVLNDNHTFLLPQGRLGPSQLFRFAYGSICELVVEFISESDLRQCLWELHTYEADKSVPMNPKRLEFLTWTYASVVEGATASTSGRTINLISDAKNSWDLPLSDNVRQLLGKTVQFKGTGKDHNVDRIYIREKLKETLACYGYITGSFCFLLPCSILLGRREISILSDDTRRGNVSKFTATRLLNDAEQILLAFDYRGLSADVADLLIGSNFMQKLSNEGSVQFIELGEKFQNKTPYPKGIYNSKGLLITQLKKLYRNARNPTTNFDQILNNFKLLQLMPILFLSAELNKALPLEYASSIGSLKQLKDITNIPLLIKIIHQATHTSWTTQHNLLDKFKENAFKKNTLLHQYFKTTTQPQQQQPQQTLQLAQQKPSTLNAPKKAQQAALPQIIAPASTSPCKSQQQPPTQQTNQPIVINLTGSGSNGSIEAPPHTFSQPASQPATSQVVIAAPKSPTQMIIDDNLSSSFKEQLQLSSTPTSGIRSNNWRSQYLQYKQVGSVPGNNTSGMDRISSSFRTRFAGWKRKLLAYISSEASESVFLNKVSECEQFARSEWERFRHISPDHTATISDICSNLYGLSSSSRLISGGAAEFYNNTGNPVILLCRTLIHWTPTFWRDNVVERMPMLEDEIVQFSRNLLGEISKLLMNKVNMPAEEKAQHNKLLQYCQSATDRNVHNKIQYIQSFFIGQNMTQLFYAISLDTLCSELTSKASADPKQLVRYHELIEMCFHSAPLMAASKIQQKLLEMLRTALTYLDSIEKHLEHTIQYLLNSPFRIKRQIQMKPKIDFTLNVIDNYINLVDPIEDPNHPRPEVVSPQSTSSSSSSNNSSSSAGGCGSSNQSNSRSPSPQSSPNMISSPAVPSSPQQQDRMEVDVDGIGSANPPFNKRIKKPTTETTYASESQGSISTKGSGTSQISAQLDDALLVRLLVPALQSLDLEGAKYLSALSIRAIGATCPNLKKLSLAYCTNIPSESLAALGIACKQLESINLKGCHQLTNVGLLYVVRGCPNLTSIDLSGCMKITDSAIHELFQNSRRLQTLDLRRCPQLTDAAFQSFNLTTLLNIDLLECNQITDIAVIQICNTSRSLSSIKLSSKNITDQSLKRIAAKCRQLTVLDLIACENITDSGVQSIVRGCPELSSLNLCSSKNITTAAFQIDEDLLTDSSVGSSSMMGVGDHSSDSSMDSLMAAAASTANELCLKSLKHLDLNRCIAINDSSVLTLTMQATMIETISLAYCEDITDEAVMSIAQRLHHLKNIDLSKCKHITDQSIIEIVKNRGPVLNRLVLFSCTQVTDLSIVQVATVCRSLIHLDVSQCEKITDASLVKISQGLPLLKVLCMEECVITDVGASSLGSINEGIGCQHLEVLKFGYCRFISDASLAKLSFGCPMIASIDLSYCSNLITPRGIRSAIKMWPRLHTLRLRGYNSLTNEGLIEGTPMKLKSVNLSWCINLDDSALIKFAKGCPALENLDISRCPKISDNALETVLDACPSIRVVNVAGCKEITSFTVQKLASLGKSIYR
ncbi:Non-receptor tyrosine kinase spore lysis A [Heterostelium album PN500]|uniref:Non-receptor tyrosine kinase spore lysis A n=1 Tax=Heterostelium pallidum (strain ATCC 26659 / Pp 5 / PN500) TaxID=670386 RepID=D3BDF6_HETP5|nr:Non-receptor tyrosine kinase spore lysis A [Heterostelium album PN500]EFA80600.1 Non-receptor tyrosine kinase spore lysis A [Heterostelium album PN500]|eukprot:XP_020432720.1 Non-receptor tyrosine kinase spore lysis A [Heterostelium album PN500]